MSHTASGDERTGTLWWIRSVLGSVLLCAMLALLIITIGVPMVAGAERFTVLTGSMQPTYPPGTLIVVKPAGTDELQVGTPITYQLEPGRPAVVTHRIIETRQETTGRQLYITQGDANDAPDAQPVLEDQIRGQVWYSIPYLGYVNNWLTGQQRAWIIGALVVGLFGYAAAMFIGGVRDHRRSRREHSKPTKSDDAQRI